MTRLRRGETLWMSVAGQRNRRRPDSRQTDVARARTEAGMSHVHRARDWAVSMTLFQIVVESATPKGVGSNPLEGILDVAGPPTRRRLRRVEAGSLAEEDEVESPSCSCERPARDVRAALRSAVPSSSSCGRFHCPTPVSSSPLLPACASAVVQARQVLPC